jgi:hypothetical protein
MVLQPYYLSYHSGIGSYILQTISSSSFKWLSHDPSPCDNISLTTSFLLDFFFFFFSSTSWSTKSSGNSSPSSPGSLRESLPTDGVRSSDFSILKI